MLDSHQQALDLKRQLEKRKLHVKWHSFFQPTMEDGVSLVKLSELMPKDVNKLTNSRKGGIRDGIFRGGITIEEPDE